MTKLSVNLNRVALLRNSRPLTFPSVTRAAQVCIDAGAHGITVHPRPDERHIRRTDVYELKEMISGVEYNIEGNPFPDFMDMVRDVVPDQCTLVPDEPRSEYVRSRLGFEAGWRAACADYCGVERSGDSGFSVYGSGARGYGSGKGSGRGSR